MSSNDRSQASTRNTVLHFPTTVRLCSTLCDKMSNEHRQ